MSWRRVLGGIGALATLGILGLLVQTGQSQSPAGEASPPTDQSYIGVKQCSACHFKQFGSWKKTKHATDAFKSLPEKYKADVTCLPCHSTGYGTATGFKDVATTPNLTGTTCEACHGPGSKHAAIAKQYANKKQLAPDEEKAVRGSIYKVLPQNACVRCHSVQGHKDHPKYDKE